MWYAAVFASVVRATPPATPGTTRVDGEIPTPAPNGVLQQFQLAHAPNPPTSLKLYRNGVRQQQAVPGSATIRDEYSLAGNGINSIGPTWLKGDKLIADYYY
jgi:hypothetical protein